MVYVVRLGERKSLAHKKGDMDYLVKLLEEKREYVSAQEAFALADRERKLDLKS